MKVEYETLDDFADSLGITLEELAVRANAFWANATAFEYRRALESPDVAFPYLLCRKVIGVSAGDSTAVASGRDHRLAIDEAIAAASKGVDIPEGSSTVLDPYDTLINDGGMYCAFARLGGSVAEAVDCGDDAIGVECIVQPLLVAMKLMPGTIKRIVEAIEQFYSQEDPVEEEEVYAPPIPIDVNRTATIEDLTGKVGGGPSPIAKPKPSFPMLDVVLCPGVVKDEIVTEYIAGNKGESFLADIQERATAWLMANIGEGDEAKRMLSQTFYWTSDSAAAMIKELGGQPEQAALLGKALDVAKTTDVCASTFTNRLTWTGIVLPRFQGVHVEFMNTGANEIDQACALALAIALATLPQVCTLEITSTPVPFNDRAQWLVQSFKQDERPFFDAGIRGEGQIVAVSDTGVDVHNCYFSDPNEPVPTVVPNFAHRKIVQYWSFVDDSDYEYGHGSHCAGTVLGKKVSMLVLRLYCRLPTSSTVVSKF